MRHPCKDCRLTFRYEHDLQEHGRIGHVKSSQGPTWSDKDVDELPKESEPAERSDDFLNESEPSEIPVEVQQELIEEVVSEINS